MAIWRQYQLGARIRRLPKGREERLALDRSGARELNRSLGRLVTLRTYPRPVGPLAIDFSNVPPSPYLARPLTLYVEEGEATVVRELSFGPTLGEILALGRQPKTVVAAILDQLLEGLCALHASGRTHLRLAPDTVRFDLLSGVVKIADLEAAALLPDPPADLVPRYLEPDVRVGLGTPASDVFSVGRLGEALLRGGSPVGAWEAAPPGAGEVLEPLWSFVMKCQAPLADGRPLDAPAALHALKDLGIAPVKKGAVLPLGRFIRTHVGALRELRRWRAQPLPSVDTTDGRSYREVLASAQAGRLWALLGAGAVMAASLSVYLAGAPAHGGEVDSRFGTEACSDAVQVSIVGSPDAAPNGFPVVTLEIPPDTAVAVDGCPVAIAGDGTKLLAAATGRHELRAAVGNDIVLATFDAKAGETQTIDLAEEARPRGDSAAAVNQLAKAIAQPIAKLILSPVVVGTIEPETRQVLSALLFQAPPALRATLPDPLGLAVDGLSAAVQRLSASAALCDQKISAAVTRELGPPGPGLDEDNLHTAAAILVTTRIAGPGLQSPLKTESDALAALGVTPSRRLLTAVGAVAGEPSIVSCIGDLGAAAREADLLGVLVLQQLPLPKTEGRDDEDDTQ